MKSILLSVLFLLSTSVLAHSGGTDASGCHTNHATSDYHCHNPKAKEVSREVASDKDEDLVVFNTKTKKIHRPGCKSAKSCTVNCVTIKREDAEERGGVPCGNCGG